MWLGPFRSSFVCGLKGFVHSRQKKNAVAPKAHPNVVMSITPTWVCHSHEHGNAKQSKNKLRSVLAELQSFLHSFLLFTLKI